MHRLSPALTVIESNLFDPSPALVRRWRAGDPTLSPERRAALDADPAARAIAEALEAAPPERLPADLEPPEEPATPVTLPPRLADLIRRRREAAAAYAGAVPGPGSILRISRAIGPEGPLDWDLNKPLYVLLSEPAEHPDIGYGWLVTGELDYATHWDLILDQGDGPLDPDAVMVQVWNPVHCYLPARSAIVGQVRRATLEAARSLALDLLGDPPDAAAANPGAWVERLTSDGHPIVTGTPLGDEDDPRWRYQELYFAAAGFIRDLARHAARALAPAAPWWQRVLDALRDAAGQGGLVLAPVVVAELGSGDSVSGEAEVWRLGDRLDLQLFPSPKGDSLRLRAVLHGPDPLTVALLADGRTRQSRTLTADAPEGSLYAGADEGLTLRVSDASGAVLLEARLPKSSAAGADPAGEGPEGAEPTDSGPTD